METLNSVDIESGISKKVSREQMNIVVIGHVDHGKSTVVGRLLADTDSLPAGKLDDVKARCAKNAKPFEYAFLLDALKDEQSQGITIDSARCFFHSDKREYIIIDAPGHIEFLKNMISGAARAEAAVLVIDAKEGIRENSKRHGYLLSMLGIKQVVIVVNKMDLVDYSQEVFEGIKRDYTEFLNKIGTTALGYIPVSAMDGVNIVSESEKTVWYKGNSVLNALDAFEKEPAKIDKPLRFPVQDIYKFTEGGDDRRIVAGRVETGSVNVGDEVVFSPSGKKSRIASIEAFNVDVKDSASAGESTGVTLDEQIYITPGEMLSLAKEPLPLRGTQIKVNLFWMGRQPFVKGKRYKLKIATSRIPVWLRSVEMVLDATDLSTSSLKEQIERHDVAECVLETLKPVAFDLSQEIAETGRFVLIDNYEIAGGGVILGSVHNSEDRISAGVRQREKSWERSRIEPKQRQLKYGQKPVTVLIAGPVDVGKIELAKKLEEKLIEEEHKTYYLGIKNSLLGIDSDIDTSGERDEFVRRLGEISHLFNDAGMIMITTASGLDDYEVKMLKQLNHPSETIVVNVGENYFNEFEPDLQIDKIKSLSDEAERIEAMLAERGYLL